MCSKQPVIGANTKYGALNPLARGLIGRFFLRLEKFIEGLSFSSVLDVGCGEGVGLWRLQHHWQTRQVVAVDILRTDLLKARENFGNASFAAASAYALPFRDNSFDLVVCTEVLEHLDAPRDSLEELRRVTRKDCVLSVPNEPIWRVLNLFRGAYIGSLGNTPGHLQHWNRRDFGRFVSQYFEIENTVSCLPWTIVHCRKKTF